HDAGAGVEVVAVEVAEAEEVLAARIDDARVEDTALEAVARAERDAGAHWQLEPRAHEVAAAVDLVVGRERPEHRRVLEPQRTRADRSRGQHARLDLEVVVARGLGRRLDEG